MATPLKPELHELQGHEPVVDAAELDAPEADHVDLDPVGVQAIEQALDEDLGLVMLEERAVQKVDADDPEGLLLQRSLNVEHAQVQGDLARLVVRVGLELDAHPAVALVAAPETPGHDGVGEGEEGGAVTTRVAEPVDVEGELVVEHGLEPGLGDVAVDLAVDGVAHRHVVGRHRLGDRPGCSAHAEEPTGHLLAGADLGHRAVPTGVQVDAESLLVRVLGLRGQGLDHHSTVITDEIDRKATAV